MNKRRRQVAWVCFEPHLTKPQLIEAIRVLERGFQKEGVSNLIAYVSKVCADCNIGAEVRKSLYGQFHELLAEKNDTLIDPLPLLQNSLPVAETVALAAQPSPAVEIAPLAAQPLPVAEPAPPPEEMEDTLSAHAKMFNRIMEQLLGNLPHQADFLDALDELSKNKHLSSLELGQHVSGWLENPDNFLWAADLSEKELINIARLVDTALREAFGPINADNQLRQAISQYGQDPLVLKFFPRQIL